MSVAAGEGIVALERNRRVARALDAEGGFAIGRICLVAGIDVDILQRHVEGAGFEIVDDSDDVAGEVFDRVLHDLGRVVLGLIVVIGVGDIDGCAGVRELASQHRAVAGLGLFREISLVFLAAGGAAGLVLVFLAAGGVAGLVLVFLAAGGAAGLVLVFLAAGGAAGLILVFLAAGGAAGLVLVFLAAGGVAGLVLVFLVAGGVVGLVLVFLAAALGVAEVDHVIVFAVF